jgi:hypothetical protein
MTLRLRSGGMSWLCGIGWAGLAMLAALDAGCSSSGSGSGVSVATACADIAAARCDEASVCSLADGETGTGFNVLENYGDKPTCVTRQTLNCTNALNAPQNGNTPAQVVMCAAVFNTFSCQDFFDNLPPTVCVPPGPRGTGASCTFNGQCASGYCNGTKTSVCGTCGAPPAVGADCTDSICANGDRCVGATTLCEAVVSSNGTCDSGHPCDRGLSCVGENAKTMTSGVCETAGTRVGLACGGTTLPGCDSTRGLYCGGPTGAKSCMQVIYPGYSGSVSVGGTIGSDGGGGSDAGVGVGPTPKGTVCGQLADGSRVGCVAGNCYTATGLATGADTGTCVPFAIDGAACDTTVGPGCMYPARCVVASGGDGATVGTCVVPIATLCPGS